jgi:hypothetical protein
LKQEFYYIKSKKILFKNKKIKKKNKIFLKKKMTFLLLNEMACMGQIDEHAVQ